MFKSIGLEKIKGMMNIKTKQFLIKAKITMQIPSIFHQEIFKMV
jgi:hypothetical protein